MKAIDDRFWDRVAGDESGAFVYSAPVRCMAYDLESRASSINNSQPLSKGENVPLWNLNAQKRELRVIRATGDRVVIETNHFANVSDSNSKQIHFSDKIKSDSDSVCWLHTALATNNYTVKIDFYYYYSIRLNYNFFNAHGILSR